MKAILILFPIGLASGAVARADGPSNTVPAEVTRAVTAVLYSGADADLGTEQGRRVHRGKLRSADAVATRLAALLAKNPRYWEAVRGRLQALPRGPKRRDARRRQIRLLAGDKHESSRGLLARELKRDPQSFDFATLIRLDGLVSGARAALRGAVGGKPEPSKLRVAVHLGLVGDKAATPLLTWATQQQRFKGRLGSYRYGVAVALKRLGVADVWKAARDAGVAQVGACLERNNLNGARWHVSQLEYYAGLVASKDVPTDFSLDRAVMSLAHGRVAALQTADAIRTALSRLPDTP